MKHIAFAKIGKSIRFNYKGDSAGGECEPPLLLQALANNNPDKTFYIVGRSDYSRLTEEHKHRLFPFGNVIDVWETCFKLSDRKNYNDPFFHHITNWFKAKGITPDIGVMMPGQIGTVTIPGIIRQVRDQDLFASVIDMTLNYTSPITVWLNETKTPFVEVITDPRYVMNQSRDMFHVPTRSISQYDYTYEHSPIKSYEEQVRVPTNITVRYGGIETIFCYGRPIPPLRNKTIGMLIGLNEGSPSRYPFLKEWILDRAKDVDVYGAWSEDITKADPRFKGSIPLEDLQSKLGDAKYTFIIPIRKGWATSKYIEMIHAGCIPFFHPTYDEQRHVKVPEFLRPQTPEELEERIKFLEEDDNRRVAMIEWLQRHILKPSYYDGSHLSDTIMFECAMALNIMFERTDVSKYTKKDIISVDDFF